MTIYLIRHGETDYNIVRRYQGMWGESTLTENGIAQAKAAATQFTNMDFDYIHVSAANRTRQTAALLFPERDNFLFSDDLREIDVGFLTNLYVKECRETRPELYVSIDAGEGYGIAGGESTQDVLERARKTADRIIEHGGETVAIISHGSFIRFLLGALLNVPYTVFPICDNCATAIIEITENRRVLRCFNKTVATSRLASDAL